MNFLTGTGTVIGGADGPTAIFVATKSSWITAALAVAAVVLAVGIVVAFRKRKKGKTDA